MLTLYFRLVDADDEEAIYEQESDKRVRIILPLGLPHRVQVTITEVNT